jgi:hypothetical protein
VLEVPKAKRVDERELRLDVSDLLMTGTKTIQTFQEALSSADVMK